MAQLVQPLRSEEPFAVLNKLVREWCGRQCLEALSQVLPAYLSFNGLTDAWSRLFDALRNARSLARYELTDEELEKVGNLIDLASQVIRRASDVAFVLNRHAVPVNPSLDSLLHAKFPATAV
jgi:hypothetical protein